jgi:hypothetical protein
MNETDTPAPAGDTIRVLIMIALVVSILTAVLFIPVTAGDDEECKNVCPTVCAGLDPWSWDGFWCRFFHPCYNTCHLPGPVDPSP